MARPNSYENILDAAENIVVEVGANHMTLEAVAKRAGISKGGLIYNFASKDVLLQAMLERLIQRFQSALEAADLNDQPGHELKAYIRSFANMPQRDERLMAALMAASSHNPKLMEPARESHRQLFHNLSASAPIKPEQTAIIMAALQGFWMMKMLGVPLLTPEEYKQSILELLKMSEHVIISG